MHRCDLVADQCDLVLTKNNGAVHACWQQSVVSPPFDHVVTYRHVTVLHTVSRCELRRTVCSATCVIFYCHGSGHCWTFCRYTKRWSLDMQLSLHPSRTGGRKRRWAKEIDSMCQMEATRNFSVWFKLLIHLLWYHSTVFPATRQRRRSRHNPAEAGTRFIDPEWMKGWIDLI